MDSTLFRCGFMIWDTEGGKLGMANSTPPHFTYPPMQISATKHIRQSRFPLAPHDGHPPSLEGMHI